MLTAEPPANSPCLRQQLEARRSKHLGVFVPKCRPDEGYEEVQCHGAVCFCTDEDGEEIDGTRVPRNQTLNCSIAVRKPAGKETKFSHEPSLMALGPTSLM